MNKLIILIVLMVSRRVELKVDGTLEELMSPSWTFIMSYLNYEEPEYNETKGYTKDDFTDNLVGYQTEPNRVRSYGWEMSADGEIPFAALLVNHKKDRFCMSTVITVTAVVTPCACVRKMGFRDARKTDFEVTDGKHEKLRHLYYEYDLDDKGVDVVVNQVEYNPQYVGTELYPHVTKVIPDRCFKIWQVWHNDENEQYAQIYEPAIALVSTKLPIDAPCPWPPYAFGYTNSSNYTAGSTRVYYHFNTNETGEIPPSALVSSFEFSTLDGKDLSRDNDGNGAIETRKHLVNLNVVLCSQLLCKTSTGFLAINSHLHDEKTLEAMMCWCDQPWLQPDMVYQRIKDPDVPVYFKTVYGGMIGAPLVHQGTWVGWTVERVPLARSQNQLRPIWTRGLNDSLILFFESQLPELSAPPRVDDQIRKGFAVRDWKNFVPDASLQLQDMNLRNWVQVGKRRFHSEVVNLLKGMSGAPFILPERYLIFILLVFVMFKPFKCNLNP